VHSQPAIHTHGEERGSFPGTGNASQEPAEGSGQAPPRRGWRRAGGFAGGGPADVLAAGAELAGLLAAVTGDGGAVPGTLAG